MIKIKIFDFFTPTEMAIDAAITYYKPIKTKMDD